MSAWEEQVEVEEWVHWEFKLRRRDQLGSPSIREMIDHDATDNQAR
jgi:hypothetical protein